MEISVMLPGRCRQVELNAPRADRRATVCKRIGKAAVEPVGLASARAFSQVPARKVGNRSECRCLHDFQPVPSCSHTCLEHLCEARPIVHHGEPAFTHECMHIRHGAACLRVV
jgi:hypothetical protein